VKIEVLVSALHRISLASQNSMSSKEECGRIARSALYEWNRAEQEARVEFDDEPEVVSYFNGERCVIESKDRVALLSRYGHELWHLYKKKRHARGALAAWEFFADLTPACKGTTSEAQATKWVVDGKWGEP
jgi:hypothetical protein